MSGVLTYQSRTVPIPPDGRPINLADTRPYRGVLGFFDLKELNDAGMQYQQMFSRLYDDTLRSCVLCNGDRVKDPSLGLCPECVAVLRG